MRLFCLILLIPTLSLACGPGLPDMRRLDAAITSAETSCKQAPDKQKLATCRRALTCVDPAKKAQHAIQDMLTTMAKMEDSAEDRLVAEAAYTGALATCGKVGYVGVGAAAATATPAAAKPAITKP